MARQPTNKLSRMLEGKIEVGSDYITIDTRDIGFEDPRELDYLYDLLLGKELDEVDTDG